MSYLDFALTGSVRRPRLAAGGGHYCLARCRSATGAQAADPIKIGLVTALVGPVGARRRGDHPRSDDRDRGDQRQGRRARTSARTGSPRRRKQSGQGPDRRARTDPAREGRSSARRSRYAGRSLPSCPLSTTPSCRSWCRGLPAPTSRRTARRTTTCSASPPWTRRSTGNRRLFAQDLQREEARADSGQQSLGRIERASA